jgi:hypothetical protein
MQFVKLHLLGTGFVIQILIYEIEAFQELKLQDLFVKEPNKSDYAVIYLKSGRKFEVEETVLQVEKLLHEVGIC